MELTHEKLLGLTAPSIFVNKMGIDLLVTSPTCYKTHFEILQWHFFPVYNFVFISKILEILKLSLLILYFTMQSDRLAD
jgi:hypothetical protein